MKFKKGDKVKYSHYVTEEAREKTMRGGPHQLQLIFRKDYEDKKSWRGTVTKSSEKGVTVVDDKGTLHNALDYLFVKAR